MEIEFFESGPGVIIENERRTLYIADIHMGIESELQARGIHLRTRGKERILRILDLIKESEPDHLVILGDVKHRVPGTSWQEFRELPFLFSSLRQVTPFSVSPGNHDPGIEEFLKPAELLRKEGSVMDGIGVMHGHTKPDMDLMGRLILCGHHHPVVSLPDQVGIALKSPCYVLGEVDTDLFQTQEEDKQPTTRVLMVPSWNELTGYGIERTFRSPFSPLSRSMIIETAECLLPDGTYAGDLKGLIHYDEYAKT